MAALLTAGIPLEKATGAAAALYPGQFEPTSTLFALNYFEDGNLTKLSPAIRAQLSGAVHSFQGLPLAKQAGRESALLGVKLRGSAKAHAPRLAAPRPVPRHRFQWLASVTILPELAHVSTGREQTHR